MRLIQLVTYWR